MAQLMYGKNVVNQLLTKPDRVQCIYLAAPDKKIIAACEEAGIPWEIMASRQQSKKCGCEHHQGIAALVEDYRLYSVEEIIASPKHKYGLVIMLDELADPHNLGAILRTADAVGADGVIFKKNNAVGLTPTVAKVSAGAIDTVKCAAVTNLTRTAQELKQKGYWIVGADMDGQDYRTLRYDFPTVLIIGNEGKGISRLLQKECDYVVSLPMCGEIESLNASVSAGILLYSIYASRFPL